MNEARQINGLRRFPLGDTITGNPHSVSVSLPMVADVVGYEEKDPRVLSALQTGYPRFVEHPLVARLAAYWKSQYRRDEGALLLCAGTFEANELVQFAGGGVVLPIEGQAMAGVWFRAGEEALEKRGRAFLQHTGTQVSSREAEAVLVDLGEMAAAFAETRKADASEATITEQLAPIVGTEASQIRLTRGGMNAFYAAFRAINALQQAEGRNRWVQLGWLYVDTISVLREMSEKDAEPIIWPAVDDLAGLRRVLEPIAGELAGIVVEAPTNPIFSVPDLEVLRELAEAVGALLVIDPSLVGVANARVLPFADVLVASQTKYAAASGDVLAGVLAVNPDGSRSAALLDAVDRWITPLAAPDRGRFAVEWDAHAGHVGSVNRTLPAVVAFLEDDPRIAEVWWAGKGECPGWLSGPGAVVSFTLKAGVEVFYDRLEMAKGPSFGTAYSLLSPYVWLAHYDLVSSADGRARLAQAGVPVDLMRLSVGTEPVEDVIATLAAALED